MKRFLIRVLLLFSCRVFSQEEDPCRYRFPDEATDKTTAGSASKKKNPFKEETSLLFSLLREQGMNPQQGIACKMNYHYSYLAELTLKQKKSALQIRISDETGHEWIQDSTLYKNRDLLRIQGNLSGSETDRKANITLNTLLETQKLPSTVTITDNAGIPKRVSGPGIFSPGSMLISAGCVITINADNRIDFGIAAGKLTWISHKKLYAIRQTDIIAGVERDKAVLLEGGLSFQASLKLEQGPFCWENQTLLFADLTVPRKPDLEFRNNLHWRPGKKIRSSLKTRYTYDRKRIPPMAFEGEIGLGVYLEKKAN